MDEAPHGRVGFGRAYGGPGKYIQGPGEIDRLPAHLKSLGHSAFLLAATMPACAPEKHRW